MYGYGIRYGYFNKTEKQVASMKLIKFTRNKLKLKKMQYDSKTAIRLIKEYYSKNSERSKDFKIVCLEIQKDFNKYRSWIIEYCS